MSTGTTLTSRFAKRLEGFLEQKRALGYSFSNLTDFKLFDRMCASRFPDETELTPEICNAWAMRRGNEAAQTINRRLPFIREFARHLIRNGEKAYILPVGTIKGAERYMPHIYTHEELAKLWEMAETASPTNNNPAARIIMPTLLRLLYCTGIRPSEAFRLTMADTNIQSGKLFIAESKGNRDRIVMLAGDILLLCRKYNEAMETMFPARTFFFARSKTDACMYGWLNRNFRKLLLMLQIESRYGEAPRLYDLRHTFATHRLYRWLNEGKDLHAMMPYLSAYMGHAKVSETYHYIHLVPGMHEEMSGFHFESPVGVFPKVVDSDE
jgi:integrase